jgi:hypothetical protein
MVGGSNFPLALPNPVKKRPFWRKAALFGPKKGQKRGFQLLIRYWIENASH